MAKKITFKDKDGIVLCPHTAIEQVEGLKVALDEKLGKTEVAADSNKLGGISSDNYMKGNGQQAHINFNEQLNVGIYRSADINSSSEGSPEGAISHGNLMVVRSGNADTLAQMYFNYTNNKIFVRTGNSNPSGWEPIVNRAWNKIRYIEDLVTTSHIADAAITPAKIQTSIALNGTPSMTIEPTTSSPDKTIASVGLVKEVVNDLGIDTRNLLANSKSITTPVGTTNYTQTVVNVPIGCSIGDVFYFNCDEITNLQGDATQYTILLYDMVNKVSLSADGVITADNRVAKITAWRDADAGNVRLLLYAGLAVDTIGNQVKYTNCTFVKGDKPMLLWQAAPEDVQANISNAETRSKAYAEDYTNAEITKIENGQTVAQKANSLYDEDSKDYKNWGEIDIAITRKIGDQFENYATKSYVQDQISNQVAVPIASETEYGKVKLATPEDVTAVEADGSAVNNAAKAVTPYTLKEYIASKNFATSSDISSAVTSAKPAIFFQAAQPAGGKDGDIWIIP